jgi:hypothetical protein
MPSSTTCRKHQIKACSECWGRLAMFWTRVIPGGERWRYEQCTHQMTMDLWERASAAAASCYVY